MYKLILAVILVVAGCTTRPNDIPTGKPRGAPIGAIDYCNRHPDSEHCHHD